MPFESVRARNARRDQVILQKKAQEEYNSFGQKTGRALNALPDAIKETEFAQNHPNFQKAVGIPGNVIDAFTDADKTAIPVAGTWLGAADSGKLLLINKRLENGGSISEKEKIFVNDYFKKEEELERKREENWGYRAGESVVGTVGFMGELFIAGLLTAPTGGGSWGVFGAQQATKLTTKQVIKKLLKDKASRKLFAASAKSFAKSKVKEAGIVTANRVTEGALSRMVGTPEFNEGGEFVGLANDGESIPKAILYSTTDNMIEVLSERAGDVFSVLGAPLKNSLIKSALLKSIVKANPKMGTSTVMNFVKKAGWNGIANEWAEERVGDVARGALYEIGMNDQEFKMPTIRDTIEELGSFVIMGTGIRAIDKAFGRNIVEGGKDTGSKTNTKTSVETPPQGPSGPSGPSGPIDTQEVDIKKKSEETFVNSMKFAPKEVQQEILNSLKVEMSVDKINALSDTHKSGLLMALESALEIDTGDTTVLQKNIDNLKASGAVSPIKKTEEAPFESKKIEEAPFESKKTEETKPVETKEVKAPVEKKDLSTIPPSELTSKELEERFIELGGDVKRENGKLYINESSLDAKTAQSFMTRKVEEAYQAQETDRKFKENEIIRKKKEAEKVSSDKNAKKSSSNKAKSKKESEKSPSKKSDKTQTKSDEKETKKVIGKVKKNKEGEESQDIKVTHEGRDFDVKIEASNNAPPLKMTLSVDGNFLGASYFDFTKGKINDIHRSDKTLIDLIKSYTGKKDTHWQDYLKGTKSQKEQVKDAVKEGAKTIKEIAEETKILEPNVRRILGVGAKEGVFERVEKGVYVLSKDGKDTAWIIPGDAMTSIKELIKNGFKSDMIFLDIPYETDGQKGGGEGKETFRRPADYEMISSDDFYKFLLDVKKITRNEDTPIFHMYAAGKTSEKKMKPYNDALIKAGLKPIAKGEYWKTHKSGELVNQPMKTDKMPPEGILLVSESGKISKEVTDSNLQFRLVRPRGYKTEKSAELLKALIEMSTEEGDMVFDPFAGSGVTGAEAVKSGRKATLIEKGYVKNTPAEQKKGKGVYKLDENGEKILVAEAVTKPRVKKALEETEDVVKKATKAREERLKKEGWIKPNEPKKDTQTLEDVKTLKYPSIKTITEGITFNVNEKGSKPRIATVHVIDEETNKVHFYVNGDKSMTARTIDLEKLQALVDSGEVQIAKKTKSQLAKEGVLIRKEEILELIKNSSDFKDGSIMTVKDGLLVFESKGQTLKLHPDAMGLDKLPEGMNIRVDVAELKGRDKGVKPTVAKLNKLSGKQLRKKILSEPQIKETILRISKEVNPSIRKMLVVDIAEKLKIGDTDAGGSYWNGIIEIASEVDEKTLEQIVVHEIRHLALREFFGKNGRAKLDTWYKSLTQKEKFQIFGNQATYQEYLKLYNGSVKMMAEEAANWALDGEFLGKIDYKYQPMFDQIKEIFQLIVKLLKKTFGKDVNPKYGQGFSDIRKMFDQIYEQNIALKPDNIGRYKTFLIRKQGILKGDSVDRQGRKGVASLNDPLITTSKSFIRQGPPNVGDNYEVDFVARERFDIPNLEKVSFGGSDRDVYDLGDGNVLKIAKTSRGFAQNMLEGEIYAPVPEVVEVGNNYVVVKKAEKPNSLTKELVRTLQDNKILGMAIRQPEVDMINKTAEHFFNKGDEETASLVQDLLNYDIMINDVTSIRNWGTIDGLPSLVDAGTLNKNLLDDYKGKKNLDDSSFREAYVRSKAARKKYGDRDGKTMYNISIKQDPNADLMEKARQYDTEEEFIRSLSDNKNTSKYKIEDGFLRLGENDLTMSQWNKLAKMANRYGYLIKSGADAKNIYGGQGIPVPEDLSSAFGKSVLGIEQLPTTNIDTDGNLLSQETVNKLKDTKLRDIEGRPKVLYHKTYREFDEFKKRAGKSNGTLYGNGVYLSESPISIGTFGNKEKQVYLNITESGQARYLKDKGWWVVKDLDAIIYDKPTKTSQELSDIYNEAHDTKTASIKMKEKVSDEDVMSVVNIMKEEYTDLTPEEKRDAQKIKIYIEGSYEATKKIEELAANSGIDLSSENDWGKYEDFQEEFYKKLGEVITKRSIPSIKAKKTLFNKAKEEFAGIQESLIPMADAIKGKSYKEAVKKLILFNPSPVPVKNPSEELVESQWARMWNVATQGGYLDLNEYVYGGQAKIGELARVSEYNKSLDMIDLGGDVRNFNRQRFGVKEPKVVTVYRGTPYPNSPIRAGDYVTTNRFYAQRYTRGRFGSVVKTQLNSEDLLIASSEYTHWGEDVNELIYYPKNYSPDTIKVEPSMSFKDFYETVNDEGYNMKTASIKKVEEKVENEADTYKENTDDIFPGVLSEKAIEKIVGSPLDINTKVTLGGSVRATEIFNQAYASVYGNKPQQSIVDYFAKKEREVFEQGVKKSFVAGKEIQRKSDLKKQQQLRKHLNEKAKLAKEKLIQTFKDKTAKREQILKDIKDYVHSNLPKKYRGDFMNRMLKAKTDYAKDKVFADVNELRKKKQRAAIIDNVEQLIKKMDRLPVQIQRHIVAITSNLNLRKSTKRIIERASFNRDAFENAKKNGFITSKDVLKEIGLLEKRPIETIETDELLEINNTLERLHVLGKHMLAEMEEQFNKSQEEKQAKMKETAVSMDLLTDKEILNVHFKRGLNKRQKGLLKFKEVRTWLRKHNLSHIGTDRVVRIMDGGIEDLSGAVATTIYNPVLDKIGVATDRIDLFRVSYNEVINKVTSEYALEQGVNLGLIEMDLSKEKFDKTKILQLLRIRKEMTEDLAVYAHTVDSSSQEKIIKGRTYSVEQILEIRKRVESSPSLMTMYNFMRTVLDKAHPELSDAYTKMHPTETLGFVEGFFPHKSDYKIVNKSDQDDIDRLASVNFGSLKSRQSGAMQILSLDALSDFQNYMEAMYYYIEMSPVIKSTRQLIEDEQFKENYGSVGQEFMKTWLKIVAKKGGHLKKRSGIEHIIDFMRSNLGPTMLGLRPSSVARQVTAALNAVAYMGEAAYSQGTMMMADKKWRQFMHNNSYQMRHRFGGDVLWEDLSELQVLKMIQDWTTKGIRVTDYLPAGATWLGGYQKKMKELGLDVDGEYNIEAGRAGDLAVRVSQATAHFASAPQILFNENRTLWRAYHIFETFILSNWAQYSEDVPAAWKKNKVAGAKKLAYLLTQNASSAGVTIGTGMLFAMLIGDDDDRRRSFGEVFRAELVGTIPHANKLFSAWNWNGSPIMMVQFVGDFIYSLKQSVKGKKQDTRTKNRILALSKILQATTGLPPDFIVSTLIKMIYK